MNRSCRTEAPPVPPRLRGISLPLLGAVFVVGLGLRLLYLWEVQDVVLLRQPAVDSAAYDEWARTIAAGDWLGSEPFYQDPLYPYFLGVLYAFLGRHLFFVYMLQLLISAAAVFPLFGLARRSFGNDWTALLAALFWALYKVDFFLAAQLEKTGPGTVLILVGLWFLIRLKDQPSLPGAAAAGFIAGLWCLFRGNFLAVLPFLFLWLAVVLRQKERHRFRLTLAIFALTAVLPPGAAVLRNRLVSGEWIGMTMQGGVNFYVGNCRENAWGVGRDPSWARRTPRFERDDFLVEAQRRTGQKEMSWAEMDRFWWQEGLREIKAEPGDYLRRLGRKALILINRHEISDNLNYDFFARHYSSLLSSSYLPGFWLAGPFGFAGLVLALIRRRGGLVAVYVLCYSLTLLASYIVERYRMPLVPPLLILAAFGIISAAEDLRRRRLLPPALYAALTLFLSLAAFPRWLEPRWDLWWQKVGHAYSRQGDWTNALDAYEKALESNPHLGQAWLGYGLALEARLRFDEALAAFERAAAYEPDYAGAHFLYGRSLERAGRKEEAQHEYEKAYALDPSLAEAAAAAARLRDELKSPPR